MTRQGDESGDSKYHADKIWFDNLLKDSFELSEDSGVEPAQHYLGIKVTRDNDKRTITLSTPALIESMIKDLEEGGHIKSDATVKQHPMSLSASQLWEQDYMVHHASDPERVVRLTMKDSQLSNDE